MSNMRITERDVDMLSWINGLGFVDINHITARYKMSPTTAYARLRKLVDRNLLRYERLVYKGPGNYFVTKEGAELDPVELSPIRHVSMAKYKHTKLIADLSLKLAEKYQAKFIPERELRSEMEYEGVGHRGHLCDVVLEMGDKKIAIEVELTTKGKRRLRSIINSYLKNFEYDEVWYFCGGNAVMNLVKSQSKGSDFIKPFLLSNWIRHYK